METTSSSQAASSSALAAHSFEECTAMAKFALSSGLTLSSDLLLRMRTLELAITQHADDRDGEILRSLGECHSTLAKLIAPTTPRTILLLDKEASKNGFLKFLGPVPVTRQMMVSALISLTALILLTLSPDVNGSASNSDILIGSGLPLLQNELFLLSAASLGASFSALFTANRYIQKGTFDPKYNISYWIRFVLGIIAGFILSTLIKVDSFQDPSNNIASTFEPFARPLLAMLGGFSASIVYRILNRLAESVESIFHGDLSEQIKMQTEAERVKIRSEYSKERQRLAVNLMELQNKLVNGHDDATKAAIGSMIQGLIDRDA